MAYKIHDNCINCGACESGCPCNAISEKDGKRVIDESLCMECGHCYDVCPVKAPERD